MKTKETMKQQQQLSVSSPLSETDNAYKGNEAFLLVLDCLNLNKTFLLHFIFSFNKGDSQKKKISLF